MNYSGTWTSDETDEELVLVFKDKKKQKRCRYCLVLQEYDGKGVFIIRNKDDPKNPIVGLKQIVHFIRRPELLSHPHTIRDILRQYVEEVSIFEESEDPMNLVTNYRFKVDLGDPPMALFQKSSTVTLYLRNHNYLAGSADADEEDSLLSRMGRKDWIIISICMTAVLIIPYVIYCLIIWDIKSRAKRN